MNFIDQMKYRYQTFGVVERLIVILVACFVLPFLLRTVLFLFSIPLISFLLGFNCPLVLKTYSIVHGQLLLMLFSMVILDIFSGI